MTATRRLTAAVLAGAVAALAAAAVAAPAAPAATLSRTAEMVHYEDPTGEECSRYFMCDQPTGRFLTTFHAGQGERNDVVVAVEDDGLSIRDAGAVLTLAPDSGCTLRDEHAAICPLDRGADLFLFDGDDSASVARDVPVVVKVDGGPGDDALVGGDGPDVLAGGPGYDLIRGGRGADAIDGGPGFDLLIGGPGDDRFEARDGAHDAVDGGRGRDVARADRRDSVHSAARRR